LNDLGRHDSGFEQLKHLLDGDPRPSNPKLITEHFGRLLKMISQ